MKFYLYALLCSILILASAPAIYSQQSQRLYFNEQGKVTASAKASFYTIITQNQVDTTLYQFTSFYMDNTLKYKGDYKVLEYPIQWEKIHDPTYFIFSKEGMHKAYSTHGGLIFEGAYTHDKGEGIHRRWYANGVLLSTIFLVAGLEEGEINTYHENGRLRTQCQAKKGLLEGELTEWEENAYKRRTVTFKKGIQTGKEKRYTSTGDLIVED